MSSVACTADKTWPEQYQALVKYQRKHGDCFMTGKHPLAKWVSTQRSRLRAGSLPSKEKKLLDRLNFPWDSLEAKWDACCQSAAAFIALHGHLNPPGNFKAGGPRSVHRPLLAKWISSQRSLYSRDLLEKSRVQKLEGIPGWTWSTSRTHAEASVLAGMDAKARAQPISFAKANVYYPKQSRIVHRKAPPAAGVAQAPRRAPLPNPPSMARRGKPVRGRRRSEEQQNDKKNPAYILDLCADSDDSESSTVEKRDQKVQAIKVEPPVKRLKTDVSDDDVENHIAEMLCLLMERDNRTDQDKTLMRTLHNQQTSLTRRMIRRCLEQHNSPEETIEKIKDIA